MVDRIQKQGLDPNINTTNPNISWDFEVVFNDGVELRSGYGTRNTHGNKAVDFSRASGTGSINKSGVVDALAVDEPRIVKSGLDIYEGYTNEVLWSEDFNKSEWNSVSGGSLTYNVPDPFGGNNAVTIESTGISPSFGQYQGSIGTIGDVWTGSFYMRRRLGFGAIQLAVGDNTFTNVNLIGDGKWYLVHLTGGSISSSAIRLYVNLATVGDKIDVWGANLTKTSKPFPYEKTEAIPATISPDICSAPMMCNMPEPGHPFTIEVDVDLPTENNRHVFRSEQTTSSGIALQTAGSDIRLVISDGTAIVTTSYVNPVGKNRITIKWEDGVQYLAINGDIVASTQNRTPTYNVSALLNIGSDGNSNNQLNKQIKAVRILQKALTVDQIAARGGYQS